MITPTPITPATFAGIPNIERIIKVNLKTHKPFITSYAHKEKFTFNRFQKYSHTLRPLVQLSGPKSSAPDKMP